MKLPIRSWLTAALPVALATLLSACQLATPIKGPGIARSGSFAAEKVGPKVFVGVTNAVLGAADRSEFDRHTRRVVKSLPTQAGYVGHSVRTRVFGNEVWTMTIWESHAALTAFVRSPVHQAAMREGLDAVTTA
jgi:heme-degrading monooxygenase HmoA